MRNLTHQLFEYFYFTRAERNASVVLSFLCFFFFFLPNFYPVIFPPPPATDFSAYRAAISAAIADQPVSEKRKVAEEVSYRSEKAEPKTVEYFSFDPNTATKEELVRLGLTARTATTLLNFRSKGGSFSEKEDLKKVYGLRQEDYDRLQSWITIKQDAPESIRKLPTPVVEKEETSPIASIGAKSENSFYGKKEYVPSQIDINQATAEDWQKLRGIGPGYAKRIINFRDKLGGFISAEQVGETYGLPDSVFQSISPYLTVSPISNKIKINEWDLDQLKAHPYINNYQATILFNYRKQHGPFTGVEDLKRIEAGFQESDWSRLAAYFSFE